MNNKVILFKLKLHSTFSVENFNNFYRNDKFIKKFFLTQGFFW